MVYFIFKEHLIVGFAQGKKLSSEFERLEGDQKYVRHFVFRNNVENDLEEFVPILERAIILI